MAAPAGAVNKKALIRGAEFLGSLGFRVTYRLDIFDRKGYLAGDDTRRLEELQGYLDDPSVHALLLARGGYGTSRIVDRLKTGVISRRPKIVAGYSDATALLLALMRRASLAVFHGPFVTDDESDLRRLLKTLSGDVRARSIGRLRALRAGRGRGILTGGNLTMIAHSLGTPFEIESAGRLLYVEEVNEAPYRVDRLVRQLALAGVFRSIRGLCIGRIGGIGAGAERRCREILLEAVGERSIPVVTGFPARHGRGNRTFPLGAPATLDADAGTIVFDPFLDSTRGRRIRGGQP